MTNKELEELMKEDSAVSEKNNTDLEEKVEASSEEVSEFDVVKTELLKAQQELEEAKDKHLRLMAEYQNYRNRTVEEKRRFTEMQRLIV